MKKIYTGKAFILFFLLLVPKISAQELNLTEYDSEGHATIKAILPNASTVRLRGLGGSWGLMNTNIPFTYLGNNMWQVTTDKLATGFHYYRLEVNGILTSNPNEKVYYGGNAGTSGLEVPGEESDFYSIKDVPHGTIRMQLYYSTNTSSYHRCFIYLPPSYDTRSNEKYPVLFLQHGSGESEFSWHMQGKVNFILDNLIADGKALPMIVVMQNGMIFYNDYYSFANEIRNDLIPLLENNYKVRTGRQSSAIAGLSLGGEQATQAGLLNIDIFDYVAGFSSSISYNGTPSVKKINDSLELLWLGWGTSDEYASWCSDEEQTFTNGGVNHVKVLFDGGHQWQVWRKCLYQFAQLLFKPYIYPTTSLKSLYADDKELIVFPNPCSDKINIQLKNNTDKELHFELSDITGKILLNFNNNIPSAQDIISERLHILPADIYLLSVSNNNSVYKVKIIKK